MKFVLIILFTALLTSCQTDNYGPTNISINYDFNKGFRIDSLDLNIDNQEFSKYIDSIESIVVDLTSKKDVFLSKKFIEMYEQPKKYINNVIFYIADATNSRQNKMIAMLLMHKKDLQNNIDILYACNYLYKEDKILTDDLIQLIFPIHLENRNIIKYYKNEIVRNVLSDIRDNPKTNEQNQKIITDILSGKIYAKQREFLDGQYNIKI
ncbi:hypothetical protein [Psychroflexus torquis]|uniref:hypothetical protein n=1 Tax=Psychroflexus torquis TaxID=57029 RepID=UPI0002DEC145|nr:hypothetical protein [Psychroflexus torquis]